MENNAYNRMIAQELDGIVRNYVNYQQKTGKEMMDDTLVPLTKPNTKYGKGLSFSDLMPLAMFALGEPKKKKTRGRPKKGGSIFTDVMGDFAPFAPLGMRGMGKKKRGGEIKTVSMKTLTPANIQAPAEPIKSGNGYARPIGGAMTGGTLGLLGDLFGFGEMPAKRPRGRPRKNAGSIGVDLMAETKNNLLTEKKKGGRKKKVANGFFSDMLSGVTDAVQTAAQIAPSALALAKLAKGKKGKRGGQKCGEGFFDNVLGSVASAVKSAPSAIKQTLDIAKDVKELNKLVKGGKINKGKGKGKTSKWIEHCKAFAKKHNMSFKDAMKDPRCKNSYKK